MFWGGTHPDELLPMEIVAELKRQPINGVSQGIVNTHAAEAGKRLLAMNMQHAYDLSQHASPPKLWEQRRALEVIKYNRSQPFGAIIDGHTANYGAKDHAWINPKRASSPLILNTLAHLGIQEIVDAGTLHGMLRHADRAVLLEIDTMGPHHNVPFWLETLRSMAQGEITGNARPEDFAWYRFVGNVTHEQREQLSIPNDKIPSFEPLEGRGFAELAALRDVPGEQLYALATAPGHEQYYAEMAIKIPPPQLELVTV